MFRTPDVPRNETRRQEIQRRAVSRCGGEGCKWACVELNHGPHAYQACESADSLPRVAQRAPSVASQSVRSVGPKRPRILARAVPRTYPSTTVAALLTLALSTQDGAA